MIMTRTEFVINNKILPTIASMTGEVNNTLSPWGAFNQAAVFEVDNNAIKNSGLIDARGKLKEEIAHVIRLLRKPERYVRLRLFSGSLLLDQLIYSCGPDGDQIALTPSGDHLHIAWPAPVTLIAAAFREYWGSGVLVSSKLNFETDPATALVFAAISDLHRRCIFADRAVMQENSSKLFDAGTIRTALLTTPPDGQWLVTSIKKVISETNLPGENGIISSLERLVALKLVEQREQAYRLTGEGLSFANSFLIIAQALNLEIGALMENGEAVSSAMLCLQAGLHDNLCIESEDGCVSLEAVAASHVGGMLETFLTAEFSQEDLLLPRANSSAEPTLVSKSGHQKDNDDPQEIGIQWYVGIKGKKYGPYSFDQLQSFVTEGRVQPENLLWRKDLPDWVQAGKIDGLF